MEKCYYKSKSIYALEVKKEFTKEHEIRLAGANNLLFCPGCKKEVIYKRGEIKDAHFAHKEVFDDCDYDKYSKIYNRRSQLYKKVRELIYNHLKNLLPHSKIEKEERLYKGHFSDIVIYFENSKVAIEIDDKSMSAVKLSNIKNEYLKNNIIDEWIVLDKVNEISKEENVYYIKRALLNNSNKNQVIILDRDNLTFTLYRMDNQQYYYDNTNVKHIFKSNIFAFPFYLVNLKCNEQGLFVEGMEIKYQNWLDERKNECRLKHLELVENIYIWDLDKLIEFVNRIVNNEVDKVDIMAFNLKQLKGSFVFKEFIEFYKSMKRITSIDVKYQYITSVIELLLVKSDNQDEII